jgi:hypothetical protein
MEDPVHGRARRPISEARRQASRRNGACSRGPKTAQGKARSARNACRHGLSRPAALVPELANELLTLARAIAGTGAAGERFEMACVIAASQLDVMRVRRARGELLDLLDATPADSATIAKAEALERYERRALSRRKSAVRRLGAALAPAFAGAGLRRAPAPSGSVPDRPNEPGCIEIGKTNPTSPMPAAGGEACFAPCRPGSRRRLAERTQGTAASANRIGRTNPRPRRPVGTGLAGRTRRRCLPAARFGRTNPSSARRGHFSSGLIDGFARAPPGAFGSCVAPLHVSARRRLAHSTS